MEKKCTSGSDTGDTRLTVGRSIRFTEHEWKATARLANDKFGCTLPANVVRMALRAFLKKHGYMKRGV